jgi:hypothetical protein
VISGTQRLWCRSRSILPLEGAWPSIEILYCHACLFRKRVDSIAYGLCRDCRRTCSTANEGDCLILAPQGLICSTKLTGESTGVCRAYPVVCCEGSITGTSPKRAWSSRPRLPAKAVNPRRSYLWWMPTSRLTVPRPAPGRTPSNATYNRAHFRVPANERITTRQCFCLGVFTRPRSFGSRCLRWSISTASARLPRSRSSVVLLGHEPRPVCCGASQRAPHKRFQPRGASSELWWVGRLRYDRQISGRRAAEHQSAPCEELVRGNAFRGVLLKEYYTFETLDLYHKISLSLHIT